MERKREESKTPFRVGGLLMREDLPWGVESGVRGRRELVLTGSWEVHEVLL